MRSWPPYLVTELKEGREAVLALLAEGQVAKAAVVGQEGQVLAGEAALKDVGLGEAIKDLEIGLPLVKELDQGLLVAEKIGANSLAFWEEVLAAQEEAWAAWLLTIPFETQVYRHVLAAKGPWTKPRLPLELIGQWSLLPLNPGLGQLLVFGDDELALETAALGARAGLRVNLITAKPREDLDPLKNVGQFTYTKVDSWAEVTATSLLAFGLAPGVLVLVTAPDNQTFLEEIKAAPCGWLGLAGAATENAVEPGLFPAAVTAAQKALGLIAAMLEN
ncbi:MAG: hypothetical protein LBS60_03120 [Deltaproteobacteria bacterium]|jgi:hypothetical protein|nr:hypothetical protein [Deltaproteobacteria bacterium]